MISAALHAALGPLVGGRVHPNTFPETDQKTPPTWPAIRFTLVDGEAFPTVNGTRGADSDDSRVQLDVVAKTYGAMIALRDQVLVAMDTIEPPASRVGMFETYDPTYKAHRAVLDYLMQASTPP